MTIIKKIIITVLVVGIATPFLVLGYFLNFDYDITSIIDYDPPVTTRIYDKNGERIANIFEEKHRYYAPYNEIPPRIIEALTAIEDTTFFEHPGVNIDAILRAAVKVIKAGSAVEGASTITQQLVKNKLLSREKKLSRKIKEAIFALKIEQTLTKEQILERYLNEIYFGHSYYGIKTAADGYFRKKLEDLTLKEMAVLVGLPKAPSTYAPTKNYEMSMGRANRVISRMYALGWIDEKSYNKALQESPKVYDDTLTRNRAPFVVDEVIKFALSQGMDDIKTGGYEIYTTIDMRLQDAAEESLKYAYHESLKRMKIYKEEDPASASKIKISLLNGAFVSLDSKSGDILALVGSCDYKKSSYNRVTQGRRQPGSAFKPFIYQVALDSGYSGMTELVDIAKTYGYSKGGEDVKWQPKNYEKNYIGLVSLREALVHSRNLATINLVNEIGLPQLLRELGKFGIENLPRNLSIALGTVSLSPLDLAKYYTSFANGGVQVTPNLINTIDKKGVRIYEKKEKSRVVIEKRQAFIMTSILRDVVRRGTASKAAVEGIELAAKTGTTNNNVDGWLVGYSPTIETVVWFGNDDNSPMYKRETGATVAAPAFARYYAHVLNIFPQIQREFTVPEGIIETNINGEKEYFSDISKPPRTEATPSAQEELVF